jgi:CIC family chloride channel protein
MNLEQPGSAGPLRRFVGFASSFRTSGKWLLLAALVGIVAGVGGIVFQIAERTIFHVTLQGIAGFVPKEAAGERAPLAGSTAPMSPVLLLVVISAGGLAAGWLVQSFAPEAEGHGTDAAIEAYHFKRGIIRPIVPIIKLLASAVTIGTGGSGGREGPIAQIGAGFGSNLATWLKLPVRDRRILLAAGMGAGIGSIFRAPLAGALFAAEILYRDSDLETEVVVPAAVASVVGYTVFSYWLPAEIRFVPLFGKELHHELSSLAELAPMTILALGLVAMGILYIKTFYGLHHWFKRLPLPGLAKPTLGAAATGIVGLALYFFWGQNRDALAVLGTGYGTLQQALSDPDKIGVRLLFAIAIVKIFTTSLTIGSGGVFGPSMVIGGCTGGAIGELLHRFVPSLVPNPAIYTVVGMAGFFTGCAHAPISTIVMVTELTGDYSLLVPTMWVSTLCFVMCQHWSLYEKQVLSRLDSPAHRGDFLVDVLEGIAVRDVPWMQRQTVFEGMPLKDIVYMLAENRQHYFPVIESDGKFAGIFSSDDVRRYLFDSSFWPLINARDVMTSQVVSVSPETDLNTVMKRFTELNLDELPVVAADDPSRLLGMLRRKDVITRYNQTMLAHKQAALSEA